MSACIDMWLKRRQVLIKSCSCDVRAVFTACSVFLFVFSRLSGLGQSKSRLRAGTPLGSGTTHRRPPPSPPDISPTPVQTLSSRKTGRNIFRCPLFSPALCWSPPSSGRLVFITEEEEEVTARKNCRIMTSSFSSGISL